MNIKRFRGHSAVKKQDHDKTDYEWAVYAMSEDKPLIGDIWQEGGYELTAKRAIREGKRCKKHYEKAYGERVRYAVYKHTRKRVK
jgi:hypothetical protein